MGRGKRLVWLWHRRNPTTSNLCRRWSTYYPTKRYFQQILSSSIPLSKKLPPYTVQTLVSFSVNNRSVGRSYFPTSLSYSLDFLCSRTVKSFSLRAWCMFYDKLCIMLCYRSIGWSYFSASLCYLVDFLYSRTMKSFSLHVWRMFYDKLWIILSVFDDDRYTV